MPDINQPGAVEQARWVTSSRTAAIDAISPAERLSAVDVGVGAS
jgi:hypothetical protein